MKGLLVHNTFLNTAKYSEINALYLDSARRAGIDMDICGNADLAADCAKRCDYKSVYDFVLFLDKDIRLAESLESAGIRVFNSSQAIKQCDDKSLMYSTLAENNISFPKTIFAPFTYNNIGYTDLKYLDGVIKELGFPIVVKECFGSFGEQVYLARFYSELKDIIAKIGAKPHLYQEFVAESSGRDIRINVIGGRAVAAMKRYNPHDFRSNITLGGVAEPYIPTEKESRLAIAACGALGAEFAGADIFYQDGIPVVCEVNANCHIKSIIDVTRINVADKVMEYIQKII